MTWLATLLGVITGMFRSRASLQIENMALRHQLGVYHRTCRRPRVRPRDRIFWSWLSRIWSDWREALVIVQPETVIAWRRRKFREYWARLTRSGKPGRPVVPREVRDLIRRMSFANPLWGAPRIVGELSKIGIDLAKSTVERYMVRRRKAPSPTWRAFLKNHARDIVGVDFFVVPTVRNQVLFAFLILAHHRRRVVHFNVTANPTAEWTAQQIVEAFPWDEAPSYLLRNRDRIFGESFCRRVRSMGIEQVVTAARSPWQNPYVERLIGSIRRECLDHVIVLNEQHLMRILRGYVCYYHRWRTHQGLEMDCPEPRTVQPPDQGAVSDVPEVGGLHHHYERVAA
ncbi:MAG: transposase [Candidatus Eisenbacteria bacterium]|nr:transposase [Candidatus Eisenbacteria bacterium]